MKKEYVKPIIESEEFVANEYVAACWTVSCLECPAYDEVYDEGKNQYISNSTPIRDGVYTYPHALGGVDPCRSVTDTSTPGWVSEWGIIGLIIWGILKSLGAEGDTTVTSYHTIQVEEKWTVTTNHPNASV